MQDRRLTSDLIARGADGSIEMATYVLIHGAWHTGVELEPTAEVIRRSGHDVYTPTLKGNRPGDAKTSGLSEAIESVVEYFAHNKIEDVILVGHSFGGMVITGVADIIPQHLRRLVYWNAFVPNDGECVNDLVPLSSQTASDAGEPEHAHGGVMLPFAVWRDAFMNDADLNTATRAYGKLNPQPSRTFSEPIRLRTNPAGMSISKSYINCTKDTAMPHHLPWHPRLSQKLGLFRLVQISGSHELCFTNPIRLGEAIIAAGRD